MDRNMKSRGQHVGEPDLVTALNKSAPQSPAEGNADSVRPGWAKKVAIPKASVDSGREGHSISGIVDAILEVGLERRGILDQLRTALVTDDNELSMKLARKLCGLSDEKSR